MNLSYWELNTYFKNIDFVIIGSGIVGLNTAYQLKLRHPKAKVLVLEKGILPEGASTKNAGFACFGSITEILSNLKTDSAEELYNLVERRYKGLQKLRQNLGDDAIDFQQKGGFEIFLQKDKDKWNESLDQMEEINQWLKPIFGQTVYKNSTKDFGFDQTIGMIETELEAHIDTGKMMRNLYRKVISKGVQVLNHIEVSELNDNGVGVDLKLKNGFEFKAKKAFLCTNAFTSKLYDLNVVPARAQVLITKPIQDLKLKGCFHMDEGYYYFRDVGNRILFGGGRNLNIDGETTSDFGLTDQIQNQLENYLKEVILPNQAFEVEHRWSGIMAMGQRRNPIVKQLSDNVYCGVRLSGMGVAIGSLVGEELADLID